MKVQQIVRVIYQLEWNIDFWIRLFRGLCRTAATSKMAHFVITVNGFQSLTIITKSSILDVVAVLDPPQLLDKNRHNIKTTLHSKMLFQKTKSAVTANKNNFIQLFRCLVRKCGNALWVIPLATWFTRNPFHDYIF